MEKSKRVGIGALLAVMLLIGVAFVSMGSAVSATPMPISETDKKLSELSKDEQKLLLKGIDSTDILTDEEKNDLTKNLKDIWSGKSSLTSSEQNEVLLKAFSIYINYLKIDQPSEVEVQWRDHDKITYLSALSVGVAENYAIIIRDNAVARDWIDGDKKFPWHWYLNFYSTEADDWTASFTSDAKIYFLMGDYNRAYASLGNASHYLEDVGNPYHTTQNPYYQLKHATYENLVHDNWQNWDLSSSIIMANPITVTDPAKAVKDLASYSNGKLSALNTAVNNNDYATIKTLTKDLLSKTASYEKGLINYAKS